MEILLYLERIEFGQAHFTFITDKPLIYSNNLRYFTIPIEGENTTVSKELIEDYYYLVTIHEIKVANSIRVIKEHLNPIMDLIPSFENLEVFWFTFKIDFRLSATALEESTQLLKTISGLEMFHYVLLWPSFNPKKIHSNWSKSMDRLKEHLEFFLHDMDVKHLYYLKGLAPRFNIENWTNEKKVQVWANKNRIESPIKYLQETLINVRNATIGERAVRNLSSDIKKLEKLPGFGVPTISIVLHALLPSYYPYYSRDMENVLRNLGFRELQRGRRGARNTRHPYLRYSDVVNKSIKAAYRGIHRDDNYDELNNLRDANYRAISYYLKTQIKLGYELNLK